MRTIELQQTVEGQTFAERFQKNHNNINSDDAILLRENQIEKTRVKNSNVTPSNELHEHDKYESSSSKSKIQSSDSLSISQTQLPQKSSLESFPHIDILA